MWQSKKTATPPSHSKNPILGRYIHQSFNSKSQNPRTSPSKNGFSSNELPSPPPPHPSILKPQTLFSQTPLPLSAQTHLHLCLRFLYYPFSTNPISPQHHSHCHHHIHHSLHSHFLLHTPPPPKTPTPSLTLHRRHHNPFLRFSQGPSPWLPQHPSHCCSCWPRQMA